MKYKIYAEKEWNNKRCDEAGDLELAIYPEDAESHRQDFIWRLTISEMESQSPILIKSEGYQRTFLVLEGTAALTYDDKLVKRLTDLEQDTFDDSARVKCFGTALSCSLVSRKGYQQSLEAVSLTAENRDVPLRLRWEKQENRNREAGEEVTLRSHTRFSQCFFCQTGYCVITFGEPAVNETSGVMEDSVFLQQGESLVLHSDPAKQEGYPKTGVMGEGLVLCAQIFYSEPDQVVTEEHPVSGGAERTASKATAEDFFQAAKIALTSFRGSKYLFPSLKKVWYDEALKAGIRKIERFYLPFVLWIAGTGILSLIGAEQWSPELFISVICGWSLFLIFFITPFLYFLALPKPVKTHIKKLDELTEHEREVLLRERKENPRLERILKKYEISGRNVYIEDGESAKKEEDTGSSV